jgi:type III secretion protein C
MSLIVRSHHLQRWTSRFLRQGLAILLTLAALNVHAGLPWPDSPYTYVNRQRNLEQVLQDFAGTFGLQLRIEDDLSGEPMPASGRSQLASPTEFLNQLCAVHGLVWYHHAGVLHVSRMSARTTRAFPTRGLAPETLKRVMDELGLLDERFGWSGVAERSIVFVSGPHSYVERLGAAIEALPEASVDQHIMVYRLRHAPVDDRVLRYRDTSVVTPGVASILRALVGESSGQFGMPVSDAADAMKAAAKDRPAQGGNGVPVVPPVARAEQRRAGNAPAIQADVRLNAIIVKDSPLLEPVYRRLIEELDVPSQLVEIEAVIVDVNSSNIDELGIDWSASGSRASASFGQPGREPDGTTLRLARTGVTNLLARIKLMEGKGGAHIVSRPSILTQDNMGALIDLSDTFYIKSVGERVAEVTPVSVGISLRVVPRVVETPQGRAIHMSVDIEDGAIQEVQVGELPTVRRSTIGTQAVVAEDRTLVIGGFNAQRSLRQREQVPVLGDVPGVGFFFGKTTQREQKFERLFLITPRIVAIHEAGRRPETGSAHE